MTLAQPPLRYAKNGDVHIACQVVGSGPLDIVFVAGFVTHLGVLWEYEGYRRFVERLASFARHCGGQLPRDEHGQGSRRRLRHPLRGERPG